MIEFFKGLLASDLWPPRWHCGYWSKFHGWLYIISDLAIWSAYFTIPIVIIKYIRKKTLIRFQKIYLLFAAFILACGLTHLLDAVTFWIPMYRLNALIRFITGIVSWVTVYHLIKILPTVFTLKTSEQLEEEIDRNKVLVLGLEDSNAQLKKQSDFIEKILDSTVDYINVFDNDLNLLSVNKQTEVLLNKKKLNLTGKNFKELFPTAIDNEYHKDLKHAATGGSVNTKIYNSPTDKKYETSFIPLMEGSKQYAVLVMSRDVTDALEKEKALETLNDELNVQNASLNRVNTELEQFAYILSHDLQSPLRKIETFSKLVTENYNVNDNKIYLDKIETSAKRMKNLISDVLEFSKVSHHNKAFKPVNLNEVLDEIKDDLELIIKTKTAIIIYEPLPMVHGIRHQLSQALCNVISNSLKYSIAEPIITISCRTTTKLIDEITKPFLEISIVDNGIGFDQKYHEDIFTPFKRLQNAADYEGTGIGLALVKKIVDMHSGQISATSEQGKGSVFTILLPM